MVWANQAIALRFVERAFDGGPEEDAPHHLQRLAEHRFVQASGVRNGRAKYLASIALACS